MCYSNTMKAIQSLKMDKKLFSVVTGFSEANDNEYWFSLSPLERLEAIELMRQIIYGYDPSSERLQRDFTIEDMQKGQRQVQGSGLSGTSSLRSVPYLSSHFFEGIDQAVGGGIMGIHWFVIAEFGQDFLGQLLTQFNPPLIETEDIPDDALDKNLVLVHGD